MTQIKEVTSISVRAVIIHQGRILTEWFAPKDLYFLPGGRIEKGEDLLMALRRELAEEIVGVELEIGRYLGKITHQWRGGTGLESCLNHYYEVALLNDRGACAHEKGRVLRWVDLSSSEATRIKPPSLCSLLKSTSDWDKVDDEI